MGDRVGHIRVAAMTHNGLVRPQNEDCIAVAEWLRARSMQSPVIVECSLDEPRVCVIADGLGGHRSGEIASLVTVRELIAASAGFTSTASVGEALCRINRRLYDIMAASPQCSGMGSTVIGLAFIDEAVVLFNIGDSRGYIRSEQYFRLLSRDDSIGGGMSSAADCTGQHTHAISQSLGGLTSFRTIDPFLLPIKQGFRSGDRYLLCSDGLTDMLDLNAIESCVVSDAGRSVQNLVQAALALGGTDNVSVMIVDLLD